MSGIFGHLNLNDSDYVFGLTTGQTLIYEAIQDYLDRVNRDLDSQIAIFVSERTESFKERFKLPGGGYMQEMGQEPTSKPGAVKATGGWDVAYPLTSFENAIVSTDVAQAYMTVGDLDRHLSTVTSQNVNSVRKKMLEAMFDNTQDTFTDKNHGSLSIEPFANDDTVTYPPVIGSNTEATEDHYAESGYTAANISDTNNPYVTIEADLVHHFGKSQGNDNVAVFINNAQKAKTEDLTDFVEVTDRFVQPGTQTSRLTGLPAMIPGRVIGRTNGCWVIEWDWVPANYMLALHLDATPPLKMRVDPAGTGLGVGLQLVSEEDDHPLRGAYYRHRFGFGCGNRLNGFVMELGTGGSYTVPTVG